jgi:hypothetical protein
VGDGAERMGWMTGFEPATTGATVRPDTRDQDASGRVVRNGNEKSTEPSRGKGSEDP